MKFEKNTFNKRITSMLKVDFKRMFTTPLFYLMMGISLVMPILILVMVTMMDGTVTVDPQTGVETVMEGFKNVWQIIGTASGDSSAMGMDIISMCNINMMFFVIAVFVPDSLIAVSFDSEPPDVKKTAFKSPGAIEAIFFANRMAGSLLNVEKLEVKANLDICSFAASANSTLP